MADFPATITAVGLIARAALVAMGMTAEPAKMEIGLGQYAPTGAETAMMTPFNPVREFTDDMTGHVVGTSTIEVGWQDPTDDVYNIGEIGFFLSDGTLFAIASQPAADGFLDVKTGGGTFYIANLQFDGQSLDDISFPVSSTAVIHSTTSAFGIMRFGTKTENRGTSEALGMTPGGLRGAVWDPPFAVAVENLNDVKYRTPGIYALDDVDTITNSPVTSTGGETGIVMVWPLSATSPQSNLVQEFFCGYPPGEVGKWMRFRLAGVWQSWVKFGSVPLNNDGGLVLNANGQLGIRLPANSGLQLLPTGLRVDLDGNDSGLERNAGGLKLSRTITVSDNPPSTSDGVAGDIWFEY